MKDDEKKMRRWIREEMMLYANTQQLERAMHVGAFASSERYDAARKTLDQYYNMEDLK